MQTGMKHDTGHTDMPTMIKAACDAAKTQGAMPDKITHAANSMKKP